MANIDLITKQDLEELKADMVSQIEQVLGQCSCRGGNKPEYIKGSELKQMFNISENTLVSWRAQGGLPYSKVGGVCYYLLSDIYSFMENRRVATQEP